MLVVVAVNPIIWLCLLNSVVVLGPIGRKLRQYSPAPCLIVEQSSSSVGTLDWSLSCHPARGTLVGALQETG